MLLLGKFVGVEPVVDEAEEAIGDIASLPVSVPCGSACVAGSGDGVSIEAQPLFHRDVDVPCCETIRSRGEADLISTEGDLDVELRCGRS